MAEATKDTGQDLDDLAALGAALGQASGKAKDQDRIKEQILDKFRTLDEDAAKALLKDDRVQSLLERISDERAQASGDPPGTVRSGWIGNAEVKGFTKKGWTEADLRKDREHTPNGAGKYVTFTPVETLLVTWNGLKRQLLADEETTVEKCFKDVYDEHRRGTKIAAEHAAYLFRKRDTISDMSIISAEGARVRGLAERGHYLAGGGSILMADAPRREEGDGGQGETGEEN